MDKKTKLKLQKDLQKCAYVGSVAQVEQLLLPHKDNELIKQLYDYLFIFCNYNCNLEVMKYAVNNGADIHIINDICIRYCKASKSSNISDEKWIEMIDYLLKNGVSIHAGNDQCLKENAEVGNIKVVKFLIEKGANIHTNSNYPLRTACKKNNKELISYLLDNNANIHDRDNEAIFNLLSHCDIDLIKLIYEKGVDLYKDPQIVLHTIDEKTFDIFKFLSDNSPINILEEEMVINAIIQLKDIYFIRYALTNGIKSDVFKEIKDNKIEDFIMKWDFNQKLNKEISYKNNINNKAKI